MNIKINKIRCTGCGLCVGECTRQHLSIVDGTAVFDGVDCIQCGHCLAVCPQNAVSMQDDTYDLNAVKTLQAQDVFLSPDRLSDFMAFRRSVRKFLEKSVEREKIEAILEVGRMSPTGSNRQKVSFVVIKKELSRLRSMAIDALYAQSQQLPADDGYSSLFVYMKEQIQRGNDRLFFGAPIVIAVFDSASGSIGGAIAASRMELMANAMGLGVCFNGLFVRASDTDRRIKEIMGKGESDRFITSLAVGYPAVSYCRTAPRKKLQVNWI